MGSDIITSSYWREEEGVHPTSPEKNMGFVPMFSIAAAGIIRATAIYMDGEGVS